MINITLIGQDIYLASRIEKGMLSSLAKLYEVHEDEIIVSAQESFLYHDGVEQTSYQILVRVEAEKKYEPLEKNVAKYLLKYMQEYAIHTRLYFLYFESSHYYERIHPDYPLYLSETNLVNLEDDEDYEDNEEIYEGDIFKDFANREKEPENEFDEEEEHDCSCEHCNHSKHS